LPLDLFTVFHLNLAYSSIEEEQRPQVVQNCYWPLLRLARQHQLPFGIEASAYTLESVAAIDPAWIDELRALTANGPCEFVGSGYAQIIGPLVPAEVNAANLRLGQEGYKSILGFSPEIALVNEQAYSSGLLELYRDTGYKAIVMEWDNPARWHPQWKPEWRYSPQIACGPGGVELPVIWNNSIAFQKFQRYAHAEMDLPEYIDYLAQHVAPESRAFSLYGNDVEVFDFRPGRYHTETRLREEGEWKRIGVLIESLLVDERFRFIRPSQVLELWKSPHAGNRLRLETPQDPVPVKKQEKYNLTRWAVTGRNDLAINTACHRICAALEPASESARWRELCYLWSSDFRTHITDRRWTAYEYRLRAMESQLGIPATQMPPPAPRQALLTPKASPPVSSAFRIRRESRHLHIETDFVKAAFNCRRGLALEALIVKNVSDKSLIGTIPHGFYQDITLGADFYSGHLVLETPGRPKMTDLEWVEPEIGGEVEDAAGEIVVIRGSIATPLGPVEKTLRLDSGGRLRLRFDLHWQQLPVGSLRLGHITLNPEAFDAQSLFFETHNGGFAAERFILNGKTIEHGRSVSFLVSASSALGMTWGELCLGDSQHAVTIRTRLNQACVVAQIGYVPVAGSFFYRASFSASELDETCREGARSSFPTSFEFEIQASKSGDQSGG
jgi:hypothetical protein